MLFRHTSKGFSLAELIITLLIIGILAAITLPQLSSFLAHNHSTTQINELIAHFNYARNEAMTRATRVVICPSIDGAHCSLDKTLWNHGWVIFVDLTPSSKPKLDSADIILYVKQRKKTLFTLTANRNYWYAYDTGRSSAGTFTLCNPENATLNKSLVINIAGRPRIDTQLANGDPINCS